MPISGKEMCKLFQAVGYEIVSGGKGSHVKLKRKNSPTITVPNHRELRKGMEHSLRKALDLIKQGRKI